MAEKDSWDKFDIIMKTVILGLVPIVIKYGFDSVSRSLETAKIINSSIESLVGRDDTKRDVSLTVLHYVSPRRETCFLFGKCKIHPDEDQIVDIAKVLFRKACAEVLQSSNDKAKLDIAGHEFKTIKHVIAARADEKYYESFSNQEAGDCLSDLEKLAQPSQLDPKQAQSQEQKKLSEIVAAVQPTVIDNENSLQSIRLVYIQYDNNYQRAEEVKGFLQGEINKKAAPGTDQVKGITENSIRYASSSDLDLAKLLQTTLESKDFNGERIKIDRLIDLSKANYKVPRGRLEIWLKD